MLLVRIGFTCILLSGLRISLKGTLTDGKIKKTSGKRRKIRGPKYLQALKVLRLLILGFLCEQKLQMLPISDSQINKSSAQLSYHFPIFVLLKRLNPKPDVTDTQPSAVKIEASNAIITADISISKPNQQHKSVIFSKTADSLKYQPLALIAEHREL